MNKHGHSISFVCPQSLTVKLDFNISKVVYYPLLISDMQDSDNYFFGGTNSSPVIAL